MASEQPLPMESLPTMRLGAGFDHLKDVLVVDLTTSVAGPYATMMLADFGASIVKIERPGRGDDSRAWGPPFLDGRSLWFLAVNRNKRSLTLDITRPEGRRVFEELVGRADVVVSNQPLNVQKKLNTDFASLRALNDSVIFASITGFGLTGERTDWTCYDLIAEGYSGVMDLTGAADGPPQRIGTPAADMLAGQDAAMAVMAALIKRGRDAHAQLLDISLVESMGRFLACRVVAYLGSGSVPRRSGGTDSVVAVYQAFETADHPLTLALGTDRIWKRFWAAAGRPDYAAMPRFGSNADRRTHRKKIVADIQDILMRASRTEWLEKFAKARVPAGPINSVAEAAADPSLQARGLFYALDDGARRVPQVGLGIQVDGQTMHPRALPPELGADTDAILTELLSYSPAQIATLRAAKAI